MTGMLVGPAFEPDCPHGRSSAAVCETCRVTAETERGWRPPQHPQPPVRPEPVLADEDLVVDRGDGTGVLVMADDPIPAHLLDRPRTPCRPPGKRRRGDT